MVSAKVLYNDSAKGAPRTPPALKPVSQGTGPACGELSDYVITASTDTLEPATTLIPGSQCDDCNRLLYFPFPLRLYDRTFTQAYVSSNGFLSLQNDTDFMLNECLPTSAYEYTIFPHWDDLDMRTAAGADLGILTSVTGSAPTRVFNIEWRACIYDLGTCAGRVNFEIKFFENRSDFEVLYGTVEGGGETTTVGVQRNSEQASQFSCYTQNSLSFGLKLTFSQPACTTPTPEPPRCPGERYRDVCPGDYFYEPVLSLSEQNVISGYNSSPPCPAANHVPCFGPYSDVTRGQTAKIVAMAAGYTEPVEGRKFQDVAEGSNFYEPISRLSDRSNIGGYPCGQLPDEPCMAPDNLPYFRPGLPVSRGQLSKIAGLAFNFTEGVGEQHFEDVPANHAFFEHTARMSERGIISGYACGSRAEEPCVGPQNLPYFRPAVSITRGQTAKIVYMSQSQVGSR